MGKVEIKAVFFDVGETLINEGRIYGEWADWLGVPQHTFNAVLGGVIARGGHHLEVLEHFRPGFDLAAEEAARRAAGVPNGFGPRDLTPEGTKDVLEREAPGMAEAMRLVSPLGRLSRAAAGTIGQALVLNTPGSTGGAIETLDAVLDVVPHAQSLLAGERPH